MKIQLFILTLFISFLISFHLQGQEKQPLQISHVTGDLYVYTTYHLLGTKLFPANSMYLVTTDGVVMIDTPWDPAQYQPLLDSIENRHHKKVVMAVSTHYHTDRTGGLDFLKQKGVRTYSSEQTYKLCKEYKENEAEFRFKNDTSFTVGQYTFRTFFAGEGHKKDNIVIWFPANRTLYGGCLIKSTEASDLGNVSEANVDAWPATIRTIKKKFSNPQFVIPGHQSWSSTSSLDYTLKLLREYKQTKGK